MTNFVPDFSKIDESFYIENKITPQELMKLWKRSFSTINCELILFVTESLRAIALNFDGQYLKITAIFYRTPTDIEEGDMLEIDGYVTADIFPRYASWLEILVIPDHGENLSDVVDCNLGWAFLRKGIFERNGPMDWKGRLKKRLSAIFHSRKN